MPYDDSFSTYEAKARFSEVMRRVREGRSVTVSYQGEPVAEIRPLLRSSGIEARVEWLRGRGVLVDPEPTGDFEPIVRRVGALGRSLAARDD